MNQVRSDPLSVIPLLEAMLRRFHTNNVMAPAHPGGSHTITQEGPAAVRECIEVLR
jgi:hypothetical protein